MTDLMSLVQISALATLVLAPGHLFVYGSAGFSKRDLKDWGRAVHETGSFRKLRILVLDSFMFPMEAVVDAVSAFPALALLGTNRRSFLPIDQQDIYGGWRVFSHESYVGLYNIHRKLTSPG